MLNKNIIAPGIIVYNIADELGDSFIDFIEDSIGDLFYTSKVVDVDNNYVDSIHQARRCSEYMLHNQILNGEDTPQKQLLTKIRTASDKCLQDFIATYSVEPLINEGWIILKYGESDKFDWHIDAGRRYPRNVSATIYFNEDYEGGEIEYKHFGISYKPKKGDLILFGSDFTYMHRVVPVRSGLRYAAVNWYRYETRPLEYVS